MKSTCNNELGYGTTYKDAFYPGEMACKKHMPGKALTEMYTNINVDILKKANHQNLWKWANRNQQIKIQYKGAKKKPHCEITHKLLTSFKNPCFFRRV